MMLFREEGERPPLYPIDRLCVPLAYLSPDELFANSRRLLPDYPFQELRLDALTDPAAALAPLKDHIAGHRAGLFLATCRRTESGGAFQGSVEAEHAMLTYAAAAGCRFVDFALESAEKLGAGALASLRQAGAAVIVSWHDFSSAGDLDLVLRRMGQLRPDMVKLVPTARTLCDNLALLKVLEENRGRPPQVIGVAMGESGAPSRILGLRCGSAFTFAPATPFAATAPGQIAAATLQQLYRVDHLNVHTKTYGVVGNPVSSSLSPLMLNTAFHKNQVNAIYLPLRADDPEDILGFARALPLAGFSVTMPFKRTVMPLLDRVDPLAARLGAVNTVRQDRDGGLSGFNTDAAGITVPLQKRLSLKGARVLVLGAGGAARAAVFGCVAQGARVTVANRTHSTAVELAEEAGAEAMTMAEISSCAVFDVLVQATPAGMRGSVPQLPFQDAWLRASLIFDLVYNPLETPLLLAARQSGREVICGVEMFVHQGAQQFELWTGQRAPVKAMEAAVLGHLRNQKR